MPISDALATQLRAGRSEFNERFVAAQRRFNTLDGDDFLAVVAECLDPVVVAANEAARLHTAAVTRAGYDAVLVLAGSALLGARSRLSGMTALWKTVLPELGAFVAAAPQRVIGALSNGLANLAAEPEAQPEIWLRLVSASALAIRRSGPVTEASIVALLEAGQIAAWRAGLAHYRDDALALLNRAGPSVAGELLGTRDHSDLLKDVLARLRHDPWWDPAAQGSAQPSLRVVRRVGGFRGFGGPFLQPPQVWCGGRYFCVSSAGDHFVLTADAFGATLHRTAPAAKDAQLGPWTLGRQGEVRLGALSASPPELANATSAAGNDTTLAVTTPLTHAVLLVAAQ